MNDPHKSRSPACSNGLRSVDELISVAIWEPEDDRYWLYPALIALHDRWQRRDEALEDAIRACLPQ